MTKTTATAKNDHATFCGCSDCEIVYSSKAFKSPRAAKMAYTKAENAWNAKRGEGNGAQSEIFRQLRETGSIDSGEHRSLKATAERCEAEAQDLFETMRAVYIVATAQGFYVNSYHFGYNATRDLIAANMD